VSPTTDLPQKRVLVVDDSKFVCTTFASILSASFAVREEADGEAAWQAIESDPSIVMVFTDLDMPKLTGFGLLTRIRESNDARIRELPVVVISGYEEEGNKQRARDLGANDFIGKSADAPEVLSRLDNVLRLVRTSRELEVSRKALDRTATHDPLTGTFTPHYLVTEGRKYFAHARRHSGELSVLALRLDSHDDIVRTAGKDVADVVITRIAKLVMERIRAEDSVARTAQATFMVVAAGTAAAQMVALSRRLRGELDEAKVTFRKQVLRFSTSFGIAALGVDPANSIEELMRLALQRLQTVPNAPAAPKPAGLPAEIERALRVLENADAVRLGAATGEVLDRLKRIAKLIQTKRR
jgi:diguanylate cyclase (GGDEF)-like protein